jgi:uncharacterized protein YkwD
MADIMFPHCTYDSGKGSISHDNFAARVKQWTDAGGKASVSAENVAAFGPPLPTATAANKAAIADKVVKQWIGSAGHKKNLLSDTNVMGACMLCTTSTCTFGQMFVKDDSFKQTATEKQLGPDG